MGHRIMSEFPAHSTSVLFLEDGAVSGPSLFDSV